MSNTTVSTADFGELIEKQLGMNTLSVVIPAYNEERGIAQIVERTLSIGPRLKEKGVADLEVIVVDDGSCDSTAAIVTQYEQVRLIRHPRNRGYGAALKTGFNHARGTLLGFLDADGTYPPEHFPDLCEVMLLHNADLVIGSRMAGAESEMPPMRRVGNWLFANLVSLIGNHRITDSASGMRVIRREALPRLYPLPDGLNFTPVMSTRALHEQIRWIEVPIPYQERVGRSKLHIVRDGLRFLRTIVWTALNYNPVRILGGIGTAFLAVGGAIGATIMGMRLAGVTRLDHLGVASLFVAGVCLMAGVSLFALGATFNYLVSLFHKRPIRQGLFGRPLFRRPLERHFGWLGLVGTLVGLAVGGASLALSVNGWPIERLWFYLLAAALALMLGMQLMIFWLIMQVLAELSRRELEVAQDLQATQLAAAAGNDED